MIVLVSSCSNQQNYRNTEVSKAEDPEAEAKQREIAEQQRRQAEEHRRAEEYREQKHLAQFPLRIRTAIQSKKIVLGMTEEQVLLSWGKPHDINKSVGSWGVHEQWVYREEYYLYFENGILTSWQE